MRRNSASKWIHLSIAVAAVADAGFTASAYGQTDTWTGDADTASWSDASNWSNGVPGTNVSITGGSYGNLSAQVNYDETSSSEINQLILDGYTLFIPQGYLSVLQEIIATSTTAQIDQSGGVNTISEMLIGDGTGSAGFYDLSGGFLSSTNQEWVGDEGTGYFDQTGGTNQLTGTAYLLVGYAGGTGTYTLAQSAVLTASREIIGGSYGTGDFYQSGDSLNTVQNGLDVGSVGPSTGIYSLSGNASLTANEELVGDGTNANGKILQNGGSNSTSTLMVGSGINSQGLYSMSSGTLSVTGAAYLCDSTEASATFDQTGGVVIISNQTGSGELSIGVFSQTTVVGTYNLNGGTLSTSNVYVGGSSSGSGGKGFFNITGGSVSTGTVEIYSGSTLTLSGGTLSASGLNFNSVPAAMQWTGGTLNLTSNVTFDSDASSTTTGAAFGSALSMGANQTLDISGNETLSASNGGTFSLTVGSGGTNIVTGSLSVGTGGTLNITGGTVSAGSLSAQIGPVYVSSGTVSVGSLALDGSPMTVNGGTVVTGAVSFALGASITQNSGNFSATGINLGSGGLLKLSGGTMSSGPLTLVSGGAEEFIYNGGSHNFNQISVAGGTLTG